jgi:hypothetical protein
MALFVQVHVAGDKIPSDRRFCVAVGDEVRKKVQEANVVLFCSLSPELHLL